MNLTLLLMDVVQSLKDLCYNLNTHRLSSARIVSVGFKKLFFMLKLMISLKEPRFIYSITSLT